MVGGSFSDMRLLGAFLAGPYHSPADNPGPGLVLDGAAEDADSAALPIAYVVLRLLIVLNWLYGAAILVLLFVMPNERWIMSAFDLTPGRRRSG
jgi:hypothetical protein